MKIRALHLASAIVVIAGMALAIYRLRPQPASGQPAMVAASSAQTPAPRTRLTPPLVGATYMGGNWSKNFINAFRREDVAPDFSRLRADGFDTVVLLASWGDFQPVFDPCCTYDERAFERLEFLIDHAQAAGLDVALRIGYGWTFQPDAGEVGARIHRLLNESRVRDAYLAYVERLGEVVRRHANVRLSFLSWEDLILHGIDGDGTKDFHAFIGSLPAGDPLRVSAASSPELPHRDGARVALFNAYWDWLLMHKIFEPSAQRIPNLTFEARIDSEPVPHKSADGKTQYEWIGHESTYRPPGADTIALYWAPFWGAQNQGEQLDANQALHLFSTLLDKVRTNSGGLPMFIDQLNVIDNTPGFERNASLKPAALAPFMDRASCVMHNAGVFGYAFWTTRDYAESPLYNPSFSYGLDGWQLATHDRTAAEVRLVKLASGDFDVRLMQGDALSQIIPERRGRLPGSDAHFPARICVRIDSQSAASLQVDAGAAPIRLEFAAAGAQSACRAIATRASGSAVVLTILDLHGSADLAHVVLFDHVQHGGLYAIDGKPGMLLGDVRTLNRHFAQAATSGACDAGKATMPAN